MPKRQETFGISGSEQLKIRAQAIVGAIDDVLTDPDIEWPLKEDSDMAVIDETIQTTMRERGVSEAEATVMVAEATVLVIREDNNG